METIQEVLTTATMYAIVVVATVEAVRKRIPFDGWKVLLVSLGVSIAVVALFLQDYTTAGIIDGARVAFVTTLIAVGGDAWAQKLAKLFASKNVFLPPEALSQAEDDSEYDPEEAPTKKDVP